MIPKGGHHTTTKTEYSLQFNNGNGLTMACCTPTTFLLLLLTVVRGEVFLPLPHLSSTSFSSQVTHSHPSQGHLACAKSCVFHNLHLSPCNSWRFDSSSTCLLANLTTLDMVAEEGRVMVRTEDLERLPRRCRGAPGCCR